MAIGMLSFLLSTAFAAPHRAKITREQARAAEIRKHSDGRKYRHSYTPPRKGVVEEEEAGVPLPLTPP